MTAQFFKGENFFFVGRWKDRAMEIEDGESQRHDYRDKEGLNFFIHCIARLQKRPCGFRAGARLTVRRWLRAVSYFLGFLTFFLAFVAIRSLLGCREQRPPV